MLQFLKKIKGVEMANILITGASRGIGKSIAKLLSYENNVFITARNEELLSSLSKEIKALSLPCDLCEDISKLKEFILNNKIDVLVNNAGEYEYSNTDNLKDVDIERTLKVNLEIPIKLSKICIPYMKEKKWGRIINIGSISGVMGEAYASVYSASKAGLIGLSKSLALELAEYGITVNTINPGWVETDLGKSSIEDSDFSLEETLEIIPQKRFVQPIEVAELVKYLLSDKAKGITGQSINLCAGLSVGI
ncbi:MAG: hypothetical protein DKM22_02775 [Candidatus Melainabacteria bacterium]|nr:MAG: hypothetical protein DKM22_02775 [Candidatus Melainabacteria bacterium]